MSGDLGPGINFQAEYLLADRALTQINILPGGYNLGDCLAATWRSAKPAANEPKSCFLANDLLKNK